MYYSFWLEFAVLMVGAVIGSAALIPYSFKLLKTSATKKPLKMPLETLAIISFLQNVLLGAVTVGIGLWVAHTLGLGASNTGALVSGHSIPYSVSQVVWYPIMVGLVIGALMTAADLAYVPHWPKPLLDTIKNTTLRENFFAGFYGGFNEEYLTRLFGISLIAWSFSRVGHHSGTTPADWVMWTAILLMAILFAVGHVPALKSVSGKVSGIMLSRTFVLNMPLAIVCGWLYWKYGIEAAIITHFAADIIYHVGGTAILNAKLSGHHDDRGTAGLN